MIPPEPSNTASTSTVPTIQPVIRRAWWRLVRFGFRLLYNELAFTYDAVSWMVSRGQWHGWQCTALGQLDLPPGVPVLELAHGTGTFTRDLRAAGYRAVSLDLSRAMGRLASRKLHRWGYRAPLIRARAQALPFAPGQFRAIVSTFPTDFIVDPATLAEAYRVLVPGGRLVVVFGGLLTGGDAADHALEWAYRVTGQRSPWPVALEPRFTAAGFRARIVTETLPHSTALLLVADKPAS